MESSQLGDDVKTKQGRPKWYLCFLCLKEGRKLSTKNIERHFETHSTKPIEEVNWCYIGQEHTLLNSEVPFAPATKEQTASIDKQRRIYCTLCKNWKRKDKFNNISFKRLPNNTCIESTCASCLKTQASPRPRESKWADKEESKSNHNQGLAVDD